MLDEIPDSLVELFNKSPKHNAIVSAKASYIAGVGTDVFGQNTTDIAKAQAKLKNINAYETYEELKAKSADSPYLSAHLATAIS